MSEMVRRMAVAISASRFYEGGTKTPQQLGEEDFEQFVPFAHAALAAMLEPTEAMVKAGMIYWDPMDGSPIRPMFNPTAPWRAMLSEALK